MDIEKVSIVGAVVSIVVISVAIAVQAGLTRRKEKKRFDSKTQTAHTFVATAHGSCIAAPLSDAVIRRASKDRGADVPRNPDAFPYTAL